MRNNYWTIGAFADWLRGTPSPGALTSTGWTEWRRQARAAHPWRYWLADEGLRYLQDFFCYIPDKLYAIKYYINNRWITRTHQLTAHRADIQPGTWCDVGNRFLPCLFNELVDFVEVELAWWHLAWEDREQRKKYSAPWYRFGWWNIRVWRCAQAGLDNLEWQSKLTNEEWLDADKKHLAEPTEQAKAALEILALYKWWKYERPLRIDPHDASGWTRHCEERRLAIKDTDEGYFDDMDSERTPEQQARITEMLDKTHALEAQYEAEDEAMMIRLIKIRRSLWT